MVQVYRLQQEGRSRAHAFPDDSVGNSSKIE